jgi:hypothetical protein
MEIADLRACRSRYSEGGCRFSHDVSGGMDMMPPMGFDSHGGQPKEKKPKPVDGVDGAWRCVAPGCENVSCHLLCLAVWLSVWLTSVSMA